MPSSIVEIIGKNWGNEKSTFDKIVNACKKAELYFSYFNSQIIVKINPNNERSLTFEIVTVIYYDSYLKEYPMAVSEPEEKIPYFVFHEFLGSSKYYSVAIANNHLDYDLIWRFAKEYIKENSEHIISLNRNAFLDIERINEISIKFGDEYKFDYKDFVR